MMPGRASLASQVLAVLERDTGRTDEDLAGLLGVSTAELDPVIGRLYRRGHLDRCGPYIVAAPPLPAGATAPVPRTNGTSGPPAGQRGPSGCRRAGEVPEPPEPPEPFGKEDTTMTTPLAAGTGDRGGLLDAALWCAARGWPVFPLRPGGKRPAFPGHDAAHCTGRDPRCRTGHQGWEPRATTDPGRIRRAWTATPYNVGIATGPAGLVVIDLDKPKPGQVPPPEWAEPGITDGADVLAALCERHGQDFPSETFMVRTGRGGLHLYFTAPPGTRLGNTSGRSERGLGWLIDTRACGGYVVAPGSVVDLPDSTGRYEVACDRSPAPLPGWLVTLLTAHRPDTPPIACRSGPAGAVRNLDRYIATALNREVMRVRTAAVGGRNHALNKAAFHLGQLIATGELPEGLAAAELHDAASVHFGIGDPPFTDQSAQATIRSGIAAGKRRPRPLATSGAAA
jgi:hypothetical protein